MSDYMDAYSKGEMAGFLCAGIVSTGGIVAVANHVFRQSRTARVNGEDARQMLRIARELEAAAESYRQAAALAFPAPVALQAAEWPR